MNYLYSSIFYANISNIIPGRSTPTQRIPNKEQLKIIKCFHFQPIWNWIFWFCVSVAQVRAVNT